VQRTRTAGFAWTTFHNRLLRSDGRAKPLATPGPHRQGHQRGVRARRRPHPDAQPGREPSRRERQLEGIAKAKAAGVHKGWPASIDVTKVRQLKAKGMGASEIAKALKIGRASVYRVLGERG